MKKVRSVIRCDKISAYEVDVPVVLCDESWRVVYKNKAAYLYKFPRLGASVLRHIGDLGCISSAKKILRFCFSWNIEGFKTAYAVRQSGPPGMILIFPRAFSLGDHDGLGEDFNDFIISLAQRLDFSAARETMPLMSSALFLLEQRCLLSALESFRRIVGSEMSLNNVAFVMEEYFGRIFKGSRGASAGIGYSFRCDFPYSSISYIHSSELLAACFLGTASRLALCGGGTLDVIVTKRGEKAVFEGVVTPVESVKKVMKEFEASAEMLILRRLADAQGWNFEIMELPCGERIAFRLLADTYRHSHVFTSEAQEYSPGEAFARFMSFIGA